MIPDLKGGVLEERELWPSAVGSLGERFLFCMSWEDAAAVKVVAAESKRERNTRFLYCSHLPLFNHCLKLSRSQLPRETGWQGNGIPCDIEQSGRKGRKGIIRTTNTQYNGPYKPPGRLFSGGTSLWSVGHNIIIQWRWIQYGCLFWHYCFKTIKSSIYFFTKWKYHTGFKSMHNHKMSLGWYIGKHTE